MRLHIGKAFNSFKLTDYLEEEYLTFDTKNALSKGQCYNEISDLKISTVKIAIMRSRFVIGQLGCSNNPLCMISA